MKLYKVACIRQVDGADRYLLLDNPRDAQIAKDAIRFEPAMVDHVDPSYIVEHDRTGFSCLRWPGKSKKPSVAQWRAIYQAILQ